MTPQSYKAQISARIIMLLQRHSRPEDLKLSDRDFVRNLVDRWQKYLAAEIVDVNE